MQGKDLKLLLKQYEEWANGLFPKLTFRDFCQRIEALAKKNEFRVSSNGRERGGGEREKRGGGEREKGESSNGI